MAKKGTRGKHKSDETTTPNPRADLADALTPPAGRPSSLIDTRVIYCGDCLEQLQKLTDACALLGAFHIGMTADDLE